MLLDSKLCSVLASVTLRLAGGAMRQALNWPEQTAHGKGTSPERGAKQKKKRRYDVHTVPPAFLSPPILQGSNLISRQNTLLLGYYAHLITTQAYEMQQAEHKPAQLLFPNRKWGGFLTRTRLSLNALQTLRLSQGQHLKSKKGINLQA